MKDSIEPCSEGQPGCRAVEKQKTLPEATISGSIACALPGAGGWCRGGAELWLRGASTTDRTWRMASPGSRRRRPRKRR